MSEQNMLGGALAEVAGPLKDFAEKLGGEGGEHWLAAFKRFLRKEESWPAFPVWKTIKLGLHKSPNGYRKALTKGKCRISNYANQIFDKITICQKEVEVDLVLVTGQQLGFTTNARRDAIYNRALECGLQKCPAEVGPALREQYPNQPNGEWVLVGMDPILGSDGDLNVFDVECNDSELWLNVHWGHPDNVWHPDYLWAFCRPRK